MANEVAYFRAATIESGGTNALTGLRTGVRIDGTNYTAGDPVSFYTLSLSQNTVYTLYVRAVDSITGEDPGNDSYEDIVLTPPQGVEVCATWNGTFQSTPLTLTGHKITGGNYPFYFKQVSNPIQSAVPISIDEVSWITGTRVAQVGTVTPTPGDGSVTLAWSDISGETGYEVRRATDAGMTANLITLTSSLAAGSTSYVNNAANGNAPVNGTTYYYQVRGYDANGVGAWSSAAVATPSVWPLDFSAGASDNLTVFPRSLAGSGSSTVGSNKCPVTTAAANDAAIRYFAAALDQSKSERFTLKQQAVTVPNSVQGLCFWSASAPAVGDNGVVNSHNLAGMRWSSTTQVNISYYSTAVTNSYCLNPATGAWGAPGDVYNFTVSAATDYTFILETRPNSGTPQIRFILADASGTPVSNGTSPWVNLSDINDAGTYPGDSANNYVYCGEPMNNYYYGTIDIKTANYEVI